jgi:hypothetical protein
LSAGLLSDHHVADQQSFEDFLKVLSGHVNSLVEMLHLSTTTIADIVKRVLNFHRSSEFNVSRMKAVEFLIPKNVKNGEEEGGENTKKSQLEDEMARYEEHELQQGADLDKQISRKAEEEKERSVEKGKETKRKTAAQLAMRSVKRAKTGDAADDNAPRRSKRLNGGVFEDFACEVEKIVARRELNDGTMEFKLRWAVYSRMC